MNQVIYIDELIVINIFINYFLLLATSGILRCAINRWRILGAAVLGGIYSLTIFIQSLNTPLSILLKILLSSTIVLAAFKMKGIKTFLRALAAFFGSNFLFAGLMFGLWIALKPKGMIFNNGTVYFNINMTLLCVSVIASYIIISVAFKLLKRKAPSNKIYTVTIKIFDKSTSAMALYDTGNTLKEGFTGSPVIVAEYGVIKELLPNELKEYFKGGDLPDSINSSEWSARLRMIPFNCVQSKGLLPAFRPDNVLIRVSNEDVDNKNVFIAVTNQSLSNGEYSILLNGLMLENFGGKERGKDNMLV